MRVFKAASMALALYALQGSRRALTRPFRASASAFRGGTHPPTEAIMKYKVDSQGNYKFTGLVDEATILSVAEKIREARFYRETILTSPAATRDYLIARLALLEHEVFASIFLDNRHSVIAFEILFTGTLDGASVHPREIVKRALHHNCAAVIFAHNHPSGHAEPSTADRSITSELKAALRMVEVRVLDHFVVGGNSTVSFAERGLL
jgi:DNA repair protein RadC